MKNSFYAAIFACQLVLIGSTIQVPEWVFYVIKCPRRIVKTNSKSSQMTRDLRYFKYISPIKLITKYCIHAFCKQFSVALETVNPKY